MRCVNDRVVIFNDHRLISYDIAASDFVNRQEYKNKNGMLDVLICKAQGVLLIAEEQPDSQKCNIVLLDLATL